MKKITLILALIAIMMQVTFAQEEEEVVEEKKKSDVVTIFSLTNWKITGGFFGPEAKVTTHHEDYVLNLGARMGMTINKKVALGLFAYGQATEATFDVATRIEPLKIRGFYGGLYGEYVLFSDKAIHFTIPVMVGGGFYTLYEEDNFWNDVDDWDDWDDFDEVESSSAFVFEPGINLEINLTTFMRFHVGASYRMVSGTDLQYLQDTDLTDLTYTAGLKFGRF